MAQKVKNPPAVQEICVRSLSQEDPLEKGMTTHSSILVWTIPQTEEPGGLQSMESQTVRQDSAHTQEEAKLAEGRISLVVYWVGLHTSNEEAEGSIPG